MMFEERFPVGVHFIHCGRTCVVMRYVDAGEAYHCGRVLGMHYEYADDSGAIRGGAIAEREYPAIEAQNSRAAFRSRDHRKPEGK